MAETAKKLNDLKLSSTDVKELNPSWKDLFIEDYLNRFNNEVILSDEMDIILALIDETKRRAYFYGRAY